MKNILRSLFNGKIIPWERRAPQSKEHLEILRKIEAEERYFMEKMSLDDCQRFQALSELHLNLWASEEENIFSYGFSLGSLLILDVIEEMKII